MVVGPIWQANKELKSFITCISINYEYQVETKKYVTGPAKTMYTCTNYIYLVNGTFLGHSLW